MFDKKRFAELLIAARGENRSMRAYSLESDVSAAHLSRLSRGLIDTPPNPETLKKLAANAQNSVTLNAFMEACGYYEEPEEVRDEYRSEVAKILFETQGDWSVRKGKHADYELIGNNGEIWEWVEGGSVIDVYGKMATYPKEDRKRSIVVRNKLELESFLKTPPTSLIGEYSLIFITENGWTESFF